MTLTWKQGEGKYAGKESVFWEAFKKDGDIGVVSKFKGGGDGYIPIVGATAEADGYIYSTKAVQKKNKTTGEKIPNEFWYFVERKQTSSLGDDSEEQKAANSVAKTDYSDGAKKGHEENVAMHKEEMAKLNELIAAINALIDTLRGKQV